VGFQRVVIEKVVIKEMVIKEMVIKKVLVMTLIQRPSAPPPHYGRRTTPESPRHLAASGGTGCRSAS
jgi:hypothetical protein